MLKKPQCPVIAIEEHYSDAELTALFTGRDAFAPPRVMKALEDVGEARLKDMDESGIDIQVLSHSAPSLQTRCCETQLDPTGGFADCHAVTAAPSAMVRPAKLHERGGNAWQEA